MQSDQPHKKFRSKINLAQKRRMESDPLLIGIEEIEKLE